MCLILFAWQVHPEYPLVVAANRDEFFSRRTAAPDFWADAPNVLAGRDLEAGGAWLGVTRDGRFAALTNYRDGAKTLPPPPSPREGVTVARRLHPLEGFTPPSRGELVSGFLTGGKPPAHYLAEIEPNAGRYNGFNLIFGNRDELWWFSNRGERGQALAPGIYGLSNHLLDTAWPKVARGKAALAAALRTLPDEAPLFALLRDERIAPDAALPRTGVSLEWERRLSAAFIRSPEYGTRSATVLLRNRAGETHFIEEGFLPDAAPGERRAFLIPAPATR